MNAISQTTTYPPAGATLATRLEPLPVNTRETCDGCGQGTTARASVILPSGGLLTLCGHHARPFGYVHPEPETRLKGSDH